MGEREQVFQINPKAPIRLTFTNLLSQGSNFRQINKQSAQNDRIKS